MKHTEEERLAFAKGLIEDHPANVISKSAKIHPLTDIGGDGFGFVRQEDQTLFPMPHTGNVVIEDNVIIRSFVTIDRAVIGSTIIGSGTVIDHHSHIAHGVKIGKNCVIVGAHIGGSCEIGDNCFIGHNSTIKNKVKIGNNVTIGQMANVTKDVPDGETWIGNPAHEITRGMFTINKAEAIAAFELQKYKVSE